MASLDIITGLVTLLDVWVIRAVKENEVDGDYFVDVVAVELAKYFVAGLDSMPALVLSTTNVYSDDELRSKCGGDGEILVPKADNNISLQSAERMSQSNDFIRSHVSPFLYRYKQ